jgi:glutamate-1-semialdehyde 2,1-aminomutase
MDEAMKKRTIERSLALYARAKEIIPGAAQLISRRPTRAALGVSPIYAERAKGCRIWDVDGNEYIDWSSGVGPIILGYCDEVVDAAVSEQIKRGSVFSILEENQVLLAEELVRLSPSAEMVRFCKGGGEACTMAVRIARGITGKDKVLFCGYHGWHDWYLAANLSGENLAGHLFNGIDPTGVPRALEGTSQPFAYGDIDSLEQLLVEYRGEVACIIMEPMRSEEPPQGYLAQVRALADEHGVLLVFDEVSSGFRVALGGRSNIWALRRTFRSLPRRFPMGIRSGRSLANVPIWHRLNRCLYRVPIGTMPSARRRRWLRCANCSGAMRWRILWISVLSSRKRLTRRPNEWG